MSFEQFISTIRNRLNLRVVIRALMFALIGVTIVSVVYAFSYVLRGYEVPEMGYLWIALPFCLVASLYAWLHRVSQSEAARYADETFNLKDVLISSMHFKSLAKRMEAHDLTIRLSEETVGTLDPKAVSLQFPRRIGWGALLGLCLMLILALMPPSEAVLAEELQRQAMLARSEESLEALEEWIEELTEASTEEEAEELDLDALRLAVEQLEATGDKREAMRQLARIEQDVGERMEELNQRSDEEVLRKAAEELNKAEDTDARQLAEDLENEDYEKAAEKMKALKQSEADMTELSEREKELAKLRAISKRMAAPSSARMDPGGSLSKNDKDGERSQESMEGLLSELDENARMMEGKLEERRLGDEKSDGESQPMACQLNKDLDSIAAKLMRMQTKNQAMAKLDMLRQQLAMAQSYASGRSPSLAKTPGGKMAGTGTDNSRRNVQEALQDNGQFTSLTGQKGEGPSLSKIEDAESGSGVSGRNAVAREREFQRQYESFVQRDDIPEEVKFAVGNYFESIHQFSPEALQDAVSGGVE